MNKTLFVSLLFIAGCSDITHYSVDNPYDVTSAIGRRALHGKLIAPGIVDIRASKDYIGQPVRDPDKNIVGYVTGMVPCDSHKSGCLSFSTKQPPNKAVF